MNFSITAFGRSLFAITPPNTNNPTNKNKNVASVKRGVVEIPYDILTEIVPYIINSGNIKDIQSLSKVNKNFRLATVKQVGNILQQLFILANKQDQLDNNQADKYKIDTNLQRNKNIVRIHRQEPTIEYIKKADLFNPQILWKLFDTKLSKIIKNDEKGYLQLSLQAIKSEPNIITQIELMSNALQNISTFNEALRKVNISICVDDVNHLPVLYLTFTLDNKKFIEYIPAMLEQLEQNT